MKPHPSAPLSIEASSGQHCVRVGGHLQHLPRMKLNHHCCQVQINLHQHTSQRVVLWINSPPEWNHMAKIECPPTKAPLAHSTRPPKGIENFPKCHVLRAGSTWVPKPNETGGTGKFRTGKREERLKEKDCAVLNTFSVPGSGHKGHC